MNTKEYLEWICARPQDGFSVRLIDEDHLKIDALNSEGEVNVYHLETDIIEMRLCRKSDHENFFFLHFELKDAEHAKGLCEEMFESLRKQESRKSVRILLSCTSGLTTSFFAQKLNEAAGTLSVDYLFDAIEYPRLYEKGFDYDVILLAPQIGYQLKKAAGVFANQTVLAIPAGIFAKYDTGALITLIQQKLSEKKKTEEEIQIAEVTRDVDLNALMFVINVTHERDSTRFIQRLYEAGKVILSEEIIKERGAYEDIIDILDTGLRSLRKNWSVDAVSISLPGYVKHGEETTEVDYAKMSEEFSAHCGLPVYVSHNSAAVAYGFYAQQGKYDIVSYHSQPAGFLIGGQGCVYRGMPIDGRAEKGGEIGDLIRAAFPSYSENPEEVTPEKAKEVLVFSLLANISIIAPEIILIRSPWFPDMEEIRQALAQHMPMESIPVLKHVRDIREYAMLGTLLYGMRRFKSEVRDLVSETQQ